MILSNTSKFDQMLVFIAFPPKWVHPITRTLIQSQRKIVLPKRLAKKPKHIKLSWPFNKCLFIDLNSLFSFFWAMLTSAVRIQACIITWTQPFLFLVCVITERLKQASPKCSDAKIIVSQSRCARAEANKGFIVKCLLGSWHDASSQT